jgi:Leucine-rich repeat (LRR) protein
LEQLEKLWCYNNYLTEISYIPNPENITELSISNNNLSLSDLTIFIQMKNLRDLRVGNIIKNKINQGIYNRIEGSLEPLKDLSKLYSLNISNTDIDSG